MRNSTTSPASNGSIGISIAQVMGFCQEPVGKRELLGYLVSLGNKEDARRGRRVTWLLS
jgi:hypothetical protein